jgi:subtilase family serine protease
MGKLMVSVARFLSLYAVLLALPAIAAAQPNLQPTGITFDTSTAVVGGTVFFDTGISNTGDVDTGVFNIKWFVDGQEVGAYGSHSGVPANSTVLDGNSQFSWVATAGTHTITFAVDVDNHVVESDESNTVLSHMYVVDIKRVY